MVDWLHKQILIEQLTLIFSYGSLCFFILIVLRKNYMKVRMFFIMKLRMKYSGILANAIHSKMEGKEEEFEQYVHQISYYSKNRTSYYIIHELLEHVRELITGPYLEAALEIRRKLPYRKFKRELVWKNRLFKGISCLLNWRGWRMKRNKQEKLFHSDLKKYLHLDKIPHFKCEKRNKSLTRWQEISLLNQLKNTPANQLPDLRRGILSNRYKVLSFTAEVVGYLRLYKYLPALLYTLQERNQSQDIIQQTIPYFSDRKDLKVIKSFIMTIENFEIKRLLAEHIKKICLFDEN